MNLRRAGLTAVLLAFLTGCGSIINFVEGPQVYGGTQYDWHHFRHPGDLFSMTFAMYDLPFSFALDTLLLPVTMLIEFIRRITGWPPRHQYGPPTDGDPNGKEAFRPLKRGGARGGGRGRERSRRRGRAPRTRARSSP